MTLFFDGSQVLDLGSHLSGLDLAVRRLDKTELVDPGIGGERADQANVWPFRRLDRAHPAVVRGMDVSNLEPGTLT